MREATIMDTIFDIGMHKGDDALFYLAKGFRVISVEAFPNYIDEAREKFAIEIARGQLVLVQRAVADVDGETITFYEDTQKDDGHTIRQDYVDPHFVAGTGRYRPLSVPTTTLHRLFDDYGVPYYLKCDIEGADVQVLDQLIRDSRRPNFISFEVATVDVIEKMKKAGYKSFQLVNQYLNPTLSMPDPPREGSLVMTQFNGHMSGLFGKELPTEKWMDSDQVMRLFEAWLTVSHLDPNFAAPGWADCHACMTNLDELRASTQPK